MLWYLFLNTCLITKLDFFHSRLTKLLMSEEFSTIFSHFQFLVNLQFVFAMELD
jgi:hypothetical protein